MADIAEEKIGHRKQHNDTSGENDLDEQHQWDKVAEEMYQKVFAVLLHTQAPSHT